MSVYGASTPWVCIFSIPESSREDKTLIVNRGNDLRMREDIYIRKYHNSSVCAKSQFFAKGDGVTDDTDEIQLAIDSLINGGEVFLPKGTYVCSISVPSNITIRGAGNGVTVLKTPNGSNNFCISNKNYSPYGTNRNISIYDLTIDGNKSNQSTNQTEPGLVDDKISGCYFKGVDGLTISNCTFKNCFKSHIFINFCKNVLVENNIMDTTEWHGGIVFSGYDVSFNGKHIAKNNTILNTALDGILAVTRNISIDNNYIYNSGCNLHGALPASGVYCTSSTINGSIKSNTIIISSGIGIDINSATNLEIVGNNISLCGFSGIWAYNGSKNIKIIGNTVYNNCNGVLLASNYGGIGVVNSSGTISQYCIILGNTCYDDQTTPTQWYGIVSFNSDYNEISNNVCYGNSQSSYYIYQNTHSTLRLPLVGDTIKSKYTIDLTSQSGYSGRSAMEIISSSDNNYAQITCDKPISFVSNSGNAQAFTHRWPSGTTSQRAVNAQLGQPYFDTTLGKPIWYNGTVWKDSTGTTV